MRRWFYKSAVAGLIIGLVFVPLLANSGVAQGNTQYTPIEKYQIAGSGGDTYHIPMAFPMSDGTAWYMSGSEMLHYDPVSGVADGPYTFVAMSATRYRYAVGPDDNIYQLDSIGNISVFDTSSRTESILNIVPPSGYDTCETSYSDFTFNGNKLILPVYCVHDDNTEAKGFLLYDVFTHDWSFMEVEELRYYGQRASLVNDGAGRVVLVNGDPEYDDELEEDTQSIMVFETDCETGEMNFIRELKLVLDFEYYEHYAYFDYEFINMLGTPPLALDQKGNFYLPKTYYDYDENTDTEYVAGGLLKIDTFTGEYSFIEDPMLVMDPDDIDYEKLLGSNTALARGTDDNIYYTSMYGMHVLDTSTQTISMFDTSFEGIYQGYNRGAITMQNNGHVWTTYRYQTYNEENEDYEDANGLVTFSIIDGQYPQVDPFICSSDDSDEESEDSENTEDSTETITPQQNLPVVIPGVPNTGWRN